LHPWLEFRRVLFRSRASSAARSWDGSWSGSRSVRRKNSCERRGRDYRRSKGGGSYRPLPSSSATAPTTMSGEGRSAWAAVGAGAGWKRGGEGRGEGG